MALVRRRIKALSLEDMPEVTTTLSAGDFSPFHPHGHIDVSVHSTEVLVEGGPTAACTRENRRHVRDSVRHAHTHTHTYRERERMRWKPQGIVRTRVEFALVVVERRVARSADKRASLRGSAETVVLAGPRALGALLTDDMVLLCRQAFLPLRLTRAHVPRDGGKGARRHGHVQWLLGQKRGRLVLQRDGRLGLDGCGDTVSHYIEGVQRGMRMDRRNNGFVVLRVRAEASSSLTQN